MALFYKLMRNIRTAELLEQHPREYLLLSLIALRMGADGAPARIGLTDYAINGMGEKGVAMRYRRAKEMLESWGLARFESSTSGTLAYLLPSAVFGMGGGGVKKDRASDRAETEPRTEVMTEQIELKLSEKDRAETEQKTEGMTERLTPNKELNTRELNTPPIIPQGGESEKSGVRSQESEGNSQGEAAGKQLTTETQRHGENDGKGLTAGKVGEVEAAGEQRKRFVKPDVAGIEAYCVERKNGVSAQAFFDHYESNGWRVGRTAMKDWKAAVRTWEKNCFQQPGNRLNGQEQRPMGLKSLKVR